MTQPAGNSENLSSARGLLRTGNLKIFSPCVCVSGGDRADDESVPAQAEGAAPRRVQGGGAERPAGGAEEQQAGASSSSSASSPPAHLGRRAGVPLQRAAGERNPDQGGFWVNFQRFCIATALNTSLSR